VPKLTFYDFTKRQLDIAGALVAGFLLLPIVVVVAILVRFRFGTPVVFRHPRPGLNEAIFTCLKFRTMTNDRDAKGNLLPDELRLTPTGAWLRKTSLDELPQLWSVLKGDMSFVGPRPLEIRYLPRYTAEQRRRHSIMPGITGWSQVNGRNAISWERKLALDIWYVDNRSTLLDLKIIALTVAKVLKGSDVSQVGYVSGPEFTGVSEEPSQQ
jgi:lipopolysaccharide/colanic/teichoic acid biosynthesis glycosyltransferase